MSSYELWAFIALLAWAIYAGGALAMELIWRPAQTLIPPGQINVLCQRMGARYRWVALGSLVIAGIASTAAEQAQLGSIGLSTPYGRSVLVLGLCWVALAAGLLTITFLVHPALHVRDPATMDPDERTEARDRVRAAIRRMDLLLRIDIVVALVALLVVSSLPAGGMG